MVIRILIYLLTWVPETSERTILLGSLSAGIVRDPLTDVLRNPAYCAGSSSELYLDVCSARPVGRAVAVTSFGLGSYVRLHTLGHEQESGAPTVQAFGLSYGHLLGKQKIGVGCYTYEKHDDHATQSLHAVSMGLFANRIADVVVKVSRFRYASHVHYSQPYPIDFRNETNSEELEVTFGIMASTPCFLSVVYCRENKVFSVTSKWDSSYAYNDRQDLIASGRAGRRVVSTPLADFYVVGQLKYWLPCFDGFDQAALLGLSFGVQQKLRSFTVLGSITKIVVYGGGYGGLGGNPVAIGLHKDASPFKIWVRLPSSIADCKNWNIELSYLFM